MGGGSRQGSSTVVSSPAPAQIPPEFKPYAQAVGQNALQYLGQFNLSDFAGNNALQVPGLDPLQRSALDRIQQQFDQGIPTPQGETDLQNLMGNVNQVAGQQVNLNPLRTQAYQGAQNTANNVGQTIGENQQEQAGEHTLQQFAGGDLANSPAIQSAVSQIGNTVTPLVANQMAKSGLGRSGALGAELQNRMVGTLLPLYQQGLQQQQSAAGQLTGLGQQLAGRQQQAQQNQMGMSNLLMGAANTIGGAQEGLSTDALNRYLGAAAQQYQPNLALGQAQQGRQTLALNQMIQGGAMDRDIAGQQAQAQQADVLRRQALAEVFATSFLGQIPSLATYPGQTSETTKTPVSK